MTLLEFVTRHVWSRPTLTDNEIVEIIRYRPDVLDLKKEWLKIAEETDDFHTLHKITSVDRKREAEGKAKP